MSIRIKRKKVKSNDELYSDIREFLTSVGLPQYHVPSTNELSNHGRSSNVLLQLRKAAAYALTLTGFFYCQVTPAQQSDGRLICPSFEPETTTIEANNENHKYEEEADSDSFDRKSNE